MFEAPQLAEPVCCSMLAMQHGSGYGEPPRLNFVTHPVIYKKSSLVPSFEPSAHRPGVIRREETRLQGLG